MNVFQYLENYTKQESYQTYGDLISGNKSSIVNSLNDKEKDIYMNMKSADKARIIKENLNLVNKTKMQPRPVTVGGIGEITQVC